MPWYWTDEITDALVRMGRIDAPRSGDVRAMPIGICRAEPTVEETAMRMQKGRDSRSLLSNALAQIGGQARHWQGRGFATPRVGMAEPRTPRVAMSWSSR